MYESAEHRGGSDSSNARGRTFTHSPPIHSNARVVFVHTSERTGGGGGGGSGHHAGEYENLEVVTPRSFNSTFPSHAIIFNCCICFLFAD